jgi:hypothetical protein
MREGDLFPTDMVLGLFSPASLPTALLPLYFCSPSLSLPKKRKEKHEESCNLFTFLSSTVRNAGLAGFVGIWSKQTLWGILLPLLA